MAMDRCTRKRISWLPLAISAVILLVFGRHASNLRKEMTRQQHRAEIFLDVIENVDSAVIVLNSNGEITDWNAAAETIFGWPAKDVIGSSIEILMPPNDRLRHHTAFKRAVLTGETLHTTQAIDCWALAKSGLLVHVDIRVRPVKHDNSLLFLAIIDRKAEIKHIQAIPKPAVDRLPPPDPKHFKRAKEGL